MNWHKWLVRGVVFAALGAIATGCALYAMYTSPAAVRELVQEKLGIRFQRVSVQLESARLRLLGGIQVNELRLSRSDGLDRDAFLYVPTAVIYHDKEQVLDGKVAIRKVELVGAKLRLVRDRDGRFNLAGILGETDFSERVPAFVIRNGTLVFEDRTLAPGGAPLLEVNDLQMTILNDPLPTLQLEGTGTVDVLGPVRFRATVPRDTMAATAEVTFSAVPVGEALARRAALLSPAVAQHLAGLRGTAEVTARLHDRPGAVAHDVTLRFRGRAEHALLPAPLEKIELEARLLNGAVPSAKLTAASGPTRVEARLADLQLPTDWKAEPDPDALIGEFDLRVEGLPVTEAVLRRLPPDIDFIKDEYAPAGPISFSYRHRKAPGRPSKVWTVRPQGMTACFKDFAYPVEGVTGTIRVDISEAPKRNIRLDLTGRNGPASVSLNGHILGDRATSEVALTVRGQAVPLDDRLRQALPERAQKVALMFLPEESRRRGLQACPMGRADFEAAITRRDGTERLLKTFTVHFKDTSVLYDAFPYPLERVTGTLIIHPDHWECRNFHGHHSGGEMFVDGRSYPLAGRAGAPTVGGTGPAPEQVSVKVRGKNILLDRELEEALSPRAGAQRAGLREAWKALHLAGRLSFEADVVDTPDQPQDINVAVDVKGISMRPAFFDYALDDVSGSVQFVRDRLYLKNLAARHGPGELRLASGTIQLGAEGGFTAWLTGLGARNVPPDEALIHALPEGAQRSLQALKPGRPLNGSGQLTVVRPPGPSGPGTPHQVWWELGLALEDDRFQAGVQVQGATGRFFCKGHHDGRRVRGVTGELALDRATVLGQPLSDVRGRLEVRGDSPDVLRFRDFKATVFGGRVGGEARVETAGVLRYEVLLEGLGLQLADFGKHNLGSAPQAQVSGSARAALHLMGEGTDLLGLTGNGRVDVPAGKMGQLPILLDLVKAFGLRLPDRTAFEQAQLTFSIEGPQMRVRQLDLLGNAISLRGAGTVDLDGSNLNLDFNATPGRPMGVLTNPIDPLALMISQQFLKIKMRGKLGQGGQVRFDKELIPGVVEPIKRLLP